MTYIIHDYWLRNTLGCGVESTLREQAFTAVNHQKDEAEVLSEREAMREA